ncbi:ABC transporter permease subunit [Pseudaeromonas sp. ZJS20]|uniref:ABC transporter permease subunit n=1 Tax=Pseudaeromonas aegiceratis TaxID=3153928 RepID=UPI00390C8AD6
MSSQTQNLTMSGSARRRIKDKLASVGVTTGGILVLVALLLIFFYLLYVVKPVFESAKVEPVSQFSLTLSGDPVLLGMDDQQDIGYRFSRQGGMDFFSIKAESGYPVGQVILHQQLDEPVTSVSVTAAGTPMVVFGLDNGTARVVQPGFLITYPNDKRTTQAVVKSPLGGEPLVLDEQGRAITGLAFEAKSDKRVFAVQTADNQLALVAQEGEENFLSGEVEWQTNHYAMPAMNGHIDQLLLTPDLRYLLVRGGNMLSVYDISDLSEVRLRSAIEVNEPGSKVTGISLLSGASSIMVTNDNGVISQWFEVVRNGQREFTRIRDFQAEGSVRLLAAEHSRKGFVTLSGDHQLGLFHATGETRLLSQSLGDVSVTSLALAPRNNGLLVERQGGFDYYRVKNNHPEVTWSALWSKVWYEGYPEPQFVWQSTSASDDFEGKFSLVPLAFGTLKAAAYAMLFAVPIALAGAIFAGYFMSAGMRKVVKPTVEIMAALPTVILGFLAGLWLAPFIEQHLPGVALCLILLPLSMLVAAFAWHQLPRKIKERVPDGWQALILVPVVVLVGYLCFTFSPLLEDWFFGGNARGFITHDLGIRFDQRNSLVVGIAMGFAVIPTIFSIAEDAVFSVPSHLTQGSLALGATPWQTLSRVVILTASPGIFSAVMMGLGRAVGETMIVLMATGNTPVMDFSIFEGLRTLSANIAVEMPESEVGSSHYRILFLAAFVLFIFTFIFNSVAEFVRQRLRDKYSSM